MIDPPEFSDTGDEDDATRTDCPCPTCGGTLYHEDGCARVGTCGQYGTVDDWWVPADDLHRMPDPPVPTTTATADEVPALREWWDRWRAHLRDEHGLVWP